MHKYYKYYHIIILFISRPKTRNTFPLRRLSGMEISSFPRLVHLVMLCVASVGCVHSLASDESALLALKGSIDSETLANNWTNATSVCNWIGVTCGGQPPRVTALNLSSMGLHGTIPPLIGNLSSLALLSLSRNHLDGTTLTSLY